MDVKPAIIGAVTLISAEGVGLSCVHCLGRGYNLSAHLLPWLTDEHQGTAVYRTKLCCLYCGGLGFVQQGSSAAPPDGSAPAAIAEPYIDVEFRREESP